MTTEAPPAWRIVFYKDARGHSRSEYLNDLPVPNGQDLAIAERRLREVLQEGLDDER